MLPPLLRIYLSPALITLAPTNLSTGNNMFTLHNKFRTRLKTRRVSVWEISL